MSSKPTDAVIEKIIASCDGNIWGALEALLLVNEHLETELRQLHEAVAGAATQNSWRRFTELEHAETLQHFSAQARSGLARQ
jgi:hypothetical protein